MIRSLPLTLALTAALAAAPLAPAHAWGEKEQNALLGLAALGTLGALYWKSQQARPAATPAPAPAYSPIPSAPRPAVSSSGQGSIHATPVAVAFNSYTPAERQRIQSRLKGWGYYRGGIDGAFGPGTYGAITSYARDGNETQRLATTAGAYALLDGLLF